MKKLKRFFVTWLSITILFGGSCLLIAGNFLYWETSLRMAFGAFAALGIWLFFAVTDLLFHKSTYTPRERKWMIAMILPTLLLLGSIIIWNLIGAR